MHATTTTAWYTTQFITNSLKQYLKKNGFRLSERDELHSTNSDHAFVSTKLLSKEIIEIRGTVSKETVTKTEEQIRKKDVGFIEITQFLLDKMLSPINFFKSTNGHVGNLCLCIPDTHRYRKVVDKLKDYFISNMLHLKIYLIDQNGSVEVVYLNPNKKTEDRNKINER